VALETFSEIRMKVVCYATAACLHACMLACLTDRAACFGERSIADRSVVALTHGVRNHINGSHITRLFRSLDCHGACEHKAEGIDWVKVDSLSRLLHAALNAERPSASKFTLQTGVLKVRARWRHSSDHTLADLRYP
jgi:hypothetical protein